MGILDFVNTPAGMGLLSGVASYAANARRGTPVNNIGRGLAGGLTGYNAGVQGIKQAEQDKVEQAYKNTMMQAQMMNAITAQENARRKAEQEKVGDDQAKFVFASLGFDPDNMDEQIGGFMNVGREDQPITASPIPNPGEGEYKLLNQEEAFGHAPKPMQAKQPNINALFSRLGWGNEEIEMFRAQAAADPKGASKFLFDSMKDVQRANLKGKVEARDYIAKERAMAKAMGMDVGDYFKTKMNKTGVNVSVPVNVMTGNAQEAAGKKEGFEIGEQAAMIENKWSAIDSIREAKEIMSQGIYSGHWAELKKTTAKASMGAIGDRQKAARTEEFIAYIGNTVVPRLKEFGGNDSNEELRYLQRIMGGDITMEPEALAAILDSAERKIARGIERLQRQRGALEQGKMPDLGPGKSRAEFKTPSSGNPPKTLNQGEILNVELRDAIAKGDTRNANLIREEMRRKGIKPFVSQPANPSSGWSIQKVQ